MNNWVSKLVAAGVCFVVLILFSVLMFDIVRVGGNEIGVLETMSGGLSDVPLTNKTYFCWPWEKIYVYPTSVQVLTMNDDQTDDMEGQINRQSYHTKSLDNQHVYVSLKMQWRIEPEHVVSLHKTFRNNIEDTAIIPILLRTVNDNVTIHDAIKIYSGSGLVETQKAIEDSLNDKNGDLRQKGIYVDSFVMNIRLEDAYVTEIAGRQIAIQKEARLRQEEKAAVAEAAKAKAIAQADYEKRVVEAQRDKQVQVLAAEAKKEQDVLNAEAEKQKTVLAAEAEKESGELKGQAILAIGKATAESEKLKFTAYSAPGAEIYAKIQVANSMANAFQNIKGYLPENMNIVTLGDSFMTAVEKVVGSGRVSK